MFVQVIEGKVSDRAALRRQLDRWNDELRPGATGFLGSTSGVTDDGVGFTIARFESAAAATANSKPRGTERVVVGKTPRSASMARSRSRTPRMSRSSSPVVPTTPVSSR